MILCKSYGLKFTSAEGLRIQYKDDENTFVNLRLGDSFHAALRCAQAVSGRLSSVLFPRIKDLPLYSLKNTPSAAWLVAGT